MMTFSELVETLKARTADLPEDAYSTSDAVRQIVSLTGASYARAYQAYLEGENIDAAILLLKVNHEA